MTKAESGSLVLCMLSVNVVTKVLSSEGLLPSNRLLASIPVAMVSLFTPTATVELGAKFDRSDDRLN